MKQSKFFLAILILALLLSSNSFAASAAAPRLPEELKKILDAAPPDPKEHSKAALTKIYLERGRAASTLGELDRELKELDAGIQTVGAKDRNAYYARAPSSSSVTVVKPQVSAACKAIQQSS